MSSQQVSNPVPHYFLGKLFLNLGKVEEAKREFQKAEVKTELLKDFSFPELFFVMGQFFEFQKDRSMSKKCYLKALKMASNKEYILLPLREKFEQLNYQKELLIVRDYLEKIDASKQVTEMEN
jgi:hypothetical protein